jgi:uncharacterized protein (TIRG00374 family)
VSLRQEELVPARLARKAPHIRWTAILWLLLTVAAGVALALNARELGGVLRVVRSGPREYLAAAVAIQLLFMANMARFYVTAFRASGLRASTPRFLLLTTASYFVNLVSNTTGLGGIGIYLREGRRNNQPLARVTAAYMAVYALGYAAFFIALGAALALLYSRGSLTRAEAAASAVILVFFSAAGLLIGAGLRSRTALESVLLLPIRPLNFASRRFLGRAVIRPEAVREAAGAFYEAAVDLKRRPLQFVLPFIHAVGVEVLSALLLLVVAQALNASIGFEVALASYVLSLLFSLVSLTPGGIGFAEASLAVLLISFGVPQTNAIAIALAFRLFDFWLPVALGSLSLALLGRGSREVVA